MKISFHGAAGMVTGSKHLITLENDHKLLLDCGMFQGFGKETYELNQFFGFKPHEVDYLFLSHAHIDHSGLIPALVKEGYKGKIYCTPATYDLCKIMLADSAHIQEADARHINKKMRKQGAPLITPLYTIDDVNKCLEQFVAVDYDVEYKVNDFIRFTFTDNGHILGSATINFVIHELGENKKIAYTGDVGRYNQPLLQNPHSFPQADIVIVESTYGDRLHSPMEESESKILNAVIDTCMHKKGKLIIPAFSLGRTQEVVYALNKLDLHGLLPDVKIFIDSPLSFSATNVMRSYLKNLNKSVKRFIETRSDPFGFEDVIYVQSREDSQRLNQINEPCIIISASGMADAGRIKHHLMHNISNPKNTVLLVGYAERESLAGKIKHGEKEVRIFGDMYQVNADVVAVDSFSAHADYAEILQFLTCQDPQQVEKVFIVHGEKESQENLKLELKKSNFKHIFIPNIHESFYL